VKIRRYEYDGETCVMFYCPGCKCSHGVPITGRQAWAFSGTDDCPTLFPSLRIIGRDGVSSCHLWVTNGKLQFLPDSQHEFKGQFVDMEDDA
jgi:hypothetical protein